MLKSTEDITKEMLRQICGNQQESRSCVMGYAIPMTRKNLR